ncbi:MAG TPA: hypothetical protein PKV96_00815 [Candidatus Saccharimonas sp.]|nr:hypothetical protein [Candidatus Saccharimonas sp.]
MENSFDKLTDHHAWARREQKIKLHEEIQLWGERILPLLHEEGAEDLGDRIALFEFLMGSVERGDMDVASEFRRLEMYLSESTRSWYTDRLGSVSEDMRVEIARRQFMTWLKLFKAGRAQQ